MPNQYKQFRGGLRCASPATPKIRNQKRRTRGSTSLFNSLNWHSFGALFFSPSFPLSLELYTRLFDHISPIPVFLFDLGLEIAYGSGRRFGAYRLEAGFYIHHR